MPRTKQDDTEDVEEVEEPSPETVQDVIQMLQARRRLAGKVKNANYSSGAREAYAEAIFLLLELPQQ